MINLLPLEIRNERIYGRRNRTLVGFIFSLLIAAILVVTIMIGSLSFVSSDEENITKTINENNTQITNLESEIQDLNAVVSRLKITNDLYESSINFSELVPEIGSLLPQGSILNSLSLTGGNKDPLSLSVDLASAEISAVLQRNLVGSNLFEAADINSITSLDTDNGYPFSADVSVSFTGSAEAKRKAAAAAAAAAAAEEEILNGNKETE